MSLHDKTIDWAKQMDRQLEVLVDMYTPIQAPELTFKVLVMIARILLLIAQSSAKVADRVP
jgi:hypothetical protein